MRERAIAVGMSLDLRVQVIVGGVCELHGGRCVRFDLHAGAGVRKDENVDPRVVHCSDAKVRAVFKQVDERRSLLFIANALQRAIEVFLQSRSG